VAFAERPPCGGGGVGRVGLRGEGLKRIGEFAEPVGVGGRAGRVGLDGAVEAVAEGDYLVGQLCITQI